MKSRALSKQVSALVLASALVSVPAHAGWLDSIKSFLGMSESTPSSEVMTQAAETAQQLDLSGLVSELSANLGVSESQAQGGLGALLNYAKTMSPEQFSSVSESIPGMDSLIGAAPALGDLASAQGGVAGLLGKAAQYSDSLQAVNTLKQQFEALGLDTSMIPKYVEQAKLYLDTPQGEKVKTMLTSSFSQFMS